MKTRPARRPVLESIEDRVLLSVIGTRSGVVERAHQKSTTSVEISPRNLALRRQSTVMAVSARPSIGSGVKPTIVETEGAGGRPLPTLRITPYRARNGYPARAYTRVSQPGALTTSITGRQATTGAYATTTELPGDLTGDGVVDLADLSAFVPHYNSKIGQPKYSAAADFNHNGRVGQDDARFILRNMTPIGPKIPLELDLKLAPGDRINHDGSMNSGGTTNRQFVTIQGHTTPGSIVFQDSGLGDYSFKGDAIVADADGNFSIGVKNADGINTNNFLVIDPYGQQVIRAFPIFWTAQAYKAR